MQQAVGDIKTQLQCMPQNITMFTNAAECDTAIKTCAVKTVKDISHRDCNVIVFGLPVPENDDVASFTSFCETHLTVKPAAESVKCLRRNAVSQKPPVTGQATFCTSGKRPSLRSQKLALQYRLSSSLRLHKP